MASRESGTPSGHGTTEAVGSSQRRTRAEETALQTFSPREVQARVRGGESADLIAAETGWPLDKVLRYAEPLLAERAYIAEQAQVVEVRRSGGGATLLESAHAAIGVAPEADAIDWDAWRREDGRWIVAARYRDAGGDHRALWTYDPAGKNLHPLDDEARTLMGARPLPLPDADVDIAEALDLVRDVPVVREEPRPHLVAVPDSVEMDVDVDVDVDVDEAGDELPLGLEPEPVGHRAETVTIAHPAAAAESASRPAARPAAARKPKGKRGRASVPTWDEILFGATKRED